MKKIFFYAAIVVAGLVIIPVFLTATTYLQLGIASFLYFTMAFFTYKYFSRRTAPASLEKPAGVLPTAAAGSFLPAETRPGPDQTTSVTSLEILNADKREFLKIIVSAGFSFFLLSIFARRAEALLFGRALDAGVVTLQDPGGNQISPAERQPTDGYHISEIDDGDYLYCGYTNNDGGWYIVKQNPGNGSFRYVKGQTNFPSNWLNRNQLNYDYFHLVFSET